MNVLVIEDESQVGHILKRGLLLHRCGVTVVKSSAAISALMCDVYDAVVLEYSINTTSAEEFVRAIRYATPDIPILVISTEHAIDIKVSMLLLCDDYLTKPFSFAELAARLYAVTRRRGGITGELISAGPLVLDTVRYVVYLHGELICLRNKEFTLLEYLLKHQGVVISREQLLVNVWDIHADLFTNTVDTHIGLLRKKIEKQGDRFIHTIPKRGYRFFF